MAVKQSELDNLSTSVNQEVSSGHRVSNPRTGICIADTNHYYFIVSDGRTKASEGLSLYELAESLRKEFKQSTILLEIMPVEILYCVEEEK